MTRPVGPGLVALLVLAGVATFTGGAAASAPDAALGPGAAAVGTTNTGGAAAGAAATAGVGPVPSTLGQTDSGGGLVVAGVLFVALATVAVAAWRTGVFERLRAGGMRSRSRSGSGAESATPTETDAAGAEADGDVTERETEPVPESLSDSDRVVWMLEENGGRMRQARIVENTEWSKSKVSMLLSDMAEDGEISKLRVGRENIISLAGHEPDAVGSPFEDEE